MFYKLLKLGTNGNFYKIIKNMYSNTFTSVKLSNGLSKSFQTRTGIKQGDGLMCTCAPCSIGNYRLNHLLYADDLILFSESKHGLQNCLNNHDNLNDYCKRWRIKINFNKSKVMIFRPSGHSTTDFFNIAGEEIGCVRKYISFLG